MVTFPNLFCSSLRLKWVLRHELGSNLSKTGPPIFHLSLAIIVQGLDRRTLALLDATSVSVDPHLGDQINASMPALIDGRAECGK